MIKFIRNWYRTKKIQAELKAELYNGIIMIVREHNDIKELLTNTYNVLKDAPLDELQQKLIEQIALLVHETNGGRHQDIDEKI